MTCPVCFSTAYDGVSLANGEVLHSTCFMRITEAVTSAERTVSTQHGQVASLRAQMERQETYLGKVIRFFGQGADPDKLRRQLTEAEWNLRQAETLHESARATATPVFDIMIDYPPDWSLRSAAVAARDKVCTNCGSLKTLQAHHVTPLSKGGTNRLSNLKLLCERCHQRTHGGKVFSGNKTTEPLAYADRVQLLQRAITSGNDVEFMYRKPSETSHKKRRVTPRALVQIDHKNGDGQTLCLNGFCHLRRAERNFALKRMKALKYARE